MIPKKIHYIWVGNNPKSSLIEECIATWKNKLPDYEIIEWNENNLTYMKISILNKPMRPKSGHLFLTILEPV